MKRLMICAALAATLALGACRSAPVEEASPENSYRVPFGVTTLVYVNVWTDPGTGCQYLITDDGFGQPRMLADGTQFCRPTAPVTTR